MGRRSRSARPPRDIHLSFLVRGSGLHCVMHFVAGKGYFLDLEDRFGQVLLSRKYNQALGSPAWTAGVLAKHALLENPEVTAK